MRQTALKIYFLVLLFLAIFSAGKAQVYPVQLSTQLLPPYSGYLPDYADPSNEKLKCILLLQDFSLTHRDVKLDITITGNGFTIQTAPTFVPLPITLYPGTPVLLTSTDLAPYLNTQNLRFTGIDPNDYESRKILPEGQYTICIKVYDYYSSQYTQLSNPSCNAAWFYLADPPFLNLPICNTSVTPLQPQNLFFQWTPMNLSSPNSVLNTEYELELFEIRPGQTNPNFIVQTTAPIFTTTTTTPFYNYGITDPTLYTGLEYVWRVRAIDLTGRDYFRNNGYSQICTFTYGNIQSSFGDDAFTLTLTGQSPSHRLIKWTWNHIASFTEYHLQVRKAGTQNWFDYYSTTPELKISPLEPNTAYEARVMGLSNDVNSDWSNISLVTTQQPPQFACNDQNIPINVLSAQPLLAATPGMILQVGQFEVIVSSIIYDGQPGYFSGQGHVLFYGKKLGVHFEHIYINDNLVVTQGKVEAFTIGVDAWLNNWITEEAQENATYVDGVISNIVVDDDVVIVTMEDGEVLNFSFPGMDYPVVLNDDSGLQYIVYPDGNVVIVTYFEFSDDVLEATNENKVIFKSADDQKYGLDPFEVTQWHADYEKILLGDSSIYGVPNKSMKINDDDFVIAEIISDVVSSSEITFKTATGQVLQAEMIDTKKMKVTLPAAGENYVVYAYEGVNKLGRIDIKVFEEKNHKVHIVALPGMNTPDATTLKNYLNKVYGQGVVRWEVQTNSISGNITWDQNQNARVDIDNYTLLNKYSDEMDAIRNASLTNEIGDDDYVLFIVPGFGDATVDGYMPYGRRYGFITTNSSLKTFAHELGHGTFGLQHTFPKIPQGTTNNLLDYGNEDLIATFQWQWMRENHWLENLMETDEPLLSTDFHGDGFTISADENLTDINKVKGFYTPAGFFISFIDDSYGFSQVQFDPITGGVNSFSYNGEIYSAAYLKHKGVSNFYGYFKLGYLDRLKAILNANLISNGFNEDLINSFPIRLSEFKAYLKSHHEEIFTEFKWSSINEQVIGNFIDKTKSDEQKRCIKRIYQIPIPSSKVRDSVLSHFTNNGEYKAPLKRKQIVLNYEDYPKNDDGTLIGTPREISNNSTSEISDWFCRLITIYEKGGWGRFLLERFLSINNVEYTEVKTKYEENAELVKLAVVKSEVYEELGQAFLEESIIEWQDVKHDRLVHSLISVNDDYNNVQNILNDPATYRNFIQEKIDRFKNKIKTLSNSTDQKIVLEVVRTMTEAEINLLPLETRLEAIKVINSGALWQNYIFNVEESSARKIFQGVKDADVTLFLSKLVSERMMYDGESVSLIYAATNNINGTMDFFDGEYAELMNILANYCYKANQQGHRFIYRYESDLSKLTFRNPKTYSQDSQNAFNLNIGDLGVNIAQYKDGFVYAEQYLVKSLLDIDPNWAENLPIQQGQNVVMDYFYNSFEEHLSETKTVVKLEENYKLHPFELVSIYFQDQKWQNLYQLTEGEAHLIPAIYLQYLQHQEADAELLKEIGTAIDALSIVTGTWGMVAFLRAGRLGMAALEFLDVVGSGISINIDQLPEGLKPFFLAYQVLIGSANLTMAISNPKSLKLLTKDACENKINLLPKADIDNFNYQYVHNRHLISGPEAEKMDKMFFYFKSKGLVGTIEETSSAVSVFSREAISGLNGFSDNIANLASQNGINLSTFKILQQKSFDHLTISEKSTINNIRNSVDELTTSSILQKTIPKSDIAKYVNGDYSQVGGFITTANDSKHLTNYTDIYNGMRLDYSGTKFHMSDGSCGVIRYKLSNLDGIEIPKSPSNGGTETAPMPFTGHGITSGTNGTLGVPEWKSPYKTPQDGAELWEVFADGSEILRAKFSISENRFILVE